MPDEYLYSTAALAESLDTTPKTIRKRAKLLGLGIDLEGRAGFRYTEADRQKLIESLRPVAPVAPKRKRRRVA